MSLTLLNRQISILLMILTGAFCKKRGLLTPEFSGGLSKFLMNVALPCSIFSAFLGDVDSSIWIQSFQIIVIMLLLHLFYILLGALLYRRQPDSRRAILKFAVLCPNTNFMGFPVISGLYGELGTLLLSIALCPSRVFIWTAGTAFFTAGSSKSRLKTLLKTPSIWAVAAGLLFFAANLNLWTPLEDAILLFSQSTTPLSMIMIGVVVADIRPAMLCDRSVWSFCLIRLFIIPCLVLAALDLAGFTGTLPGVCVMMSALPAGAMTAVFTKEYQKDEAFAAACVILSTVLSVWTIPLVNMACEALF